MKTFTSDISGKEFRQGEKDCGRDRKDYMISLKSELEIRVLHEKIDHLLLHQQQDLLENQKLQIAKLEEILKKILPSGFTP